MSAQTVSFEGGPAEIGGEGIAPDKVNGLRLHALPPGAKWCCRALTLDEYRALYPDSVEGQGAGGLREEDYPDPY